MSNKNGLFLCYNRGCGQEYDPTKNKDDSCRYHPGAPFFHDAYKGWSCCNKKCTDFTEFLNIKGCTVSKHSNEKPPEPEKPQKNTVPDTEVIEVKPIVAPSLKRPPFDSPMTTLKPEIAPSLKQQLETAPTAETRTADSSDPSEVAIGTICKNSGCNTSYEGPVTNSTSCVYHSGYPVFHEGMKYWSCCQKKTSDFDAFLAQVGCETGRHVWKKEDDNLKSVQCTWDYYQTGSHVIVSIYAKQYCPQKSIVKINPIRLSANLVFPQQDNAAFNLDLELRGVVDVQASQLSMYGTKVEIKLKKAEPGSWSRLEIPRAPSVVDTSKTKQGTLEEITPQVEAVDLNDL